MSHPNPLGLGPPRKQRHRKHRYWSRSQAINYLVEFGEATKLGGPEYLKTLALSTLDHQMRQLGYVEFSLHEDGLENFLPYYRTHKGSRKATGRRKKGDDHGTPY